MRAFAYQRPATIGEAVALLGSHGADARVLAGGTDLIIRLRDGSLRPSLVVDVKRIPELQAGISVADGLARISAATVMTDVAAHPHHASPVPRPRGGRGGGGLGADP